MGTWAQKGEYGLEKKELQTTEFMKKHFSIAAKLILITLGKQHLFLEVKC